LKSAAGGIYQQMLQEAYLLHLDTNADTLAKLHGEQKLLRKKAYDAILQMAKGGCTFCLKL
jgi:hypothetical protein